MNFVRPTFESLEGRALQAIIAILGTGTDPVGPLAGHVLRGINLTDPSQPGDIDTSSYGHDTATASIALQWDPTATILPIVITNPNDNIADADTIAQGINYAVNQHATVISISFASDPEPGYTTDSQPMLNALADAEKHNIPVVVAAGNSANNNDIEPVYPSNDDLFYRNVISVAAVDQNGVLAPFSNYGANTVTLGALGVNVPATMLSGATANVSGTSFATPMISGILAYDRQAAPHIHLQKLLHFLYTEVKATPSTIDTTIYHGAIL